MIPRVSPRTRTILAWVLFALGTLVIFVGSLTVWVRRQALDTDCLGPGRARSVLENDEVRAALSVYIVDQLYANADPQAALEQRLPTNLQGLAGPIAGALRQPAVEGVDRVPGTPARPGRLGGAQPGCAPGAARRARRRDARKHHHGRGHGDAEPAARSSPTSGQELGFGEDLAARLPPDAGQIVLLQSDQLEAAQTGVKAIKWMSWLVILIAFACYAGAIWLARGRREMLRNVGIALLLVGILLLVVRRVVGNYIVDALASGESVRDAVGSAWIIGTSLLSEVAWALIVYGVVILIGTWLAGLSRYASRVRGFIGPTLRDRPGSFGARLGACSFCWCSGARCRPCATGWECSSSPGLSPWGSRLSGAW